MKHILTLESMFFGVTRKELMRLAFQVAKRNGIPHVFKAELKSARKTWYNKFMKRHEDKLRLRQPEATSIGEPVASTDRLWQTTLICWRE